MCWANDKANFTEPIKVIYNNYDNNILPCVVKMNTQQRCWKIDDYLYSQSHTDNANSIKLLNEFCEAHPRLVSASTKNKLNYNYANTILLGSRCTALIKSCKYKLTKEQVEFGEILYDELDKILTKLDISYVNFWIEKLFSGYYQFRHNQIIKSQFESVGFERFLGNITEFPERYDKLSCNDWLNYFSSVLQSCMNS